MAVIMKAHKFADPEVSHIHEIDKLEDALIDELFYQEDEIGTFTFSVKISSGTVWVCVCVCVCVCVTTVFWCVEWSKSLCSIPHDKPSPILLIF